MSSKITIPIAVVISVIVTAGIMYAIGFEQEPQVTQTPQTEIIYVEKTHSDILEGTNDIKKISSQEELTDLLQPSLFGGGTSTIPNRIKNGRQLMKAAVMMQNQMPLLLPEAGFKITRRMIIQLQMFKSKTWMNQII